MTDIREGILARLHTILDGVQTGVPAFRNRTQFSEDMRPCVVIMDGDEIADENDNNKHALSPRRMEMSPEVYILVGDQAATVGTALNALRAVVIDAVLNDNTLHLFSLNDSAVSYEGCRFIVEDGRKMEGAMGLTFSFKYILRPDDLVP